MTATTLLVITFPVFLLNAPAKTAPPAPADTPPPSLASVAPAAALSNAFNLKQGVITAVAARCMRISKSARKCIGWLAFAAFSSFSRQAQRIASARNVTSFQREIGN
jgi:hypothetical protein